jgi:hypothetical protein
VISVAISVGSAILLPELNKLSIRNVNHRLFGPQIFKRLFAKKNHFYLQMYRNNPKNHFFEAKSMLLVVNYAKSN